MGKQLFEPVALGPVTLKNRFIKAATFEGMSPRNVVTQTLVDFHRRMAAGGVSMTTLSYVAVGPNGMGAPSEIYIHDAAAEGLAELARQVHAEGAKISVQVGHAGAVGALPGKRVMGPSKRRTIMGDRVHEMSLGEIDEVVEQFAAAGTMMREAGFDAIEVHLGHHYLLSSFMSPAWNRRRDDYGGSLDNRARLPLRVLRAVREAIGPDMAMTAKMNMRDGVRGGLEVDESIALAQRFEATGTLDAFEFSGGGSQRNQMYMFRGDVPREEFAQIVPKQFRLGFKLFGRWLLPGYPYEPGYFMPIARRFRANLSTPIIYLGGVSDLATAQAALDAGFDHVAVGRSLLREPDLIRRWEAGSTTTSTCIQCNKCMLSIYTGTRCVLDDPEPLKIERLVLAGPCAEDSPDV